MYGITASYSIFWACCASLVNHRYERMKLVYEEGITVYGGILFYSFRVFFQGFVITLDCRSFLAFFNGAGSAPCYPDIGGLSLISYSLETTHVGFKPCFVKCLISAVVHSKIDCHGGRVVRKDIPLE